MIEKVKLLSREELDIKIAEEKERHQRLKDDIETQPIKTFLDEDGYPNYWSLNVIENWHWNDPIGWFEFIEKLWYLKSFGWGIIRGNFEDTGEDVTEFHLSTAGWSGNESIIRSMQNNEMLWLDVWEQSRRGGHHIFKVKHED